MRSELLPFGFFKRMNATLPKTWVLITTMVLLSVLNLSAQSPTTITSSGTFTPAAGVNKVTVEAWGGGGAGGGVNASK